MRDTIKERIAGDSRRDARRSLAGRRGRGFTLVELLVALTIASALTAIALPTLKDSMKQTTLSRSASLVKGAFINARSQAIRTGRPFGVVVERIRNRIGDGAASTLNFTAANYSTRLYYVQSPIEYRGDAVDSVCYPVFENNPGGLPLYPLANFPLIPRFFFPQRSAGLLFASANGSVAAQNLITVGTRFSVGDSGYVFEVVAATPVFTRYQSNILIDNTVPPFTPARVPVFDFPEPGTIVDFNIVGFSPQSDSLPGIYNPQNQLPSLTLLQQARFPGALSPFKGVEFRFRTNPVPAPLAPVTLIGKTVIDLSVSGSGSDPLEFGAQAILDQDLSRPIPTLNADVLLHNVAVMFAPDGKLDGVYLDQRVQANPAGNSPVIGFVPTRVTPSTTVCFNIGFVDGILDNIDDGARYTGNVAGTTYRTGANDPPYLQPAPPAELTVDKVPNFANPDCAWISIHPLSGTISLDSVAGQPPLLQFTNFYGFQAAPNSQVARNVMRSRLHQARRLTTAGTVQ
jgi:prepilin-type N-terminal cleavage/methylation domain-containing protein